MASPYLTTQHFYGLFLYFERAHYKAQAGLNLSVETWMTLNS